MIFQSRVTEYRDQLITRRVTQHLKRLHNGRFPFDEKFWFDIVEIFSDEWHKIFQNFLKRGQPCDVH